MLMKLNDEFQLFRKYSDCIASDMKGMVKPRGINWGKNDESSAGYLVERE